MGLPSMLSERIITQINANGDQRIDQSEFVIFFLKLLMGSEDQKMLIAFKCFDFGRDDKIFAKSIELVLKHIPDNQNKRFGVSF